METLALYALGVWVWITDNWDKVSDWIVLIVFGTPLALLMTANFDHANTTEIITFLLIVAICMLVLQWKFGDNEREGSC